MYKVCSEQGCFESDIIAAMDTAVGDGVDVLSLSLGGGSAVFYADGIAVGAFGAIQKGIFVSCSAGNDGPGYYSLSNEAPWILTVGASTIDRNIKATAKIGTGQEYDGESLYQPKDFSSKLLPLVYAGAYSNDSSALCDVGTLSGVEGKTWWLTTLADAHVLPATHVSYAAGVGIKAYINSTSTPTATILFKGTVIGDQLAPKVAFFSSRGPSSASPGILKPDIIGPGVSILAAWPFSVDNATESKATFDIISDPAGNPQSYTRTVTNVGPAKSTYELALVRPHKMDISVQPDTLTFTEVNQTMTYHVVFTAQNGAGKDGITFSKGYLSWVSHQHSVTSQISVIFDTGR
ncbi:hypothetical protein M0R45_024570 [Rubus argutus]|uniref:Uncharacterized protein n=1 Tax=Rubus argutus TaxID=59490 RepID=A0AAW1WUM5_RUBAR